MFNHQQEKIVAILCAKRLGNDDVLRMLEKEIVESSEQALVLSQFYWQMVSIAPKIAHINGEGSATYWVEKLYNSLGGYLESLGYENIWNQEIDRA